MAWGPVVVRTALVFSPQGEARPSEYNIKKAKVILQKQGLIEPLVVVSPRNWTLRGESWDHERLLAAEQLGWETVIIATEGE